MQKPLQALLGKISHFGLDFIIKKPFKLLELTSKINVSLDNG